MLKRKRKINYRAKSYSNPFFRTRKKRGIYKFKAKWSSKFKLILIFTAIIIILLFWFFFFTNRFNIKNLQISGNNRIQTGDIEKIIWDQTEKRRLLFGSQKNINFFNKSGLRNELNDKYYFNELTIDKQLPDTLIIKIDEKNYSLIWFESDNYYYIDTEGNIISGADALEIKPKTYPLIDNQEGIKVVDNKINIEMETLNFITNLFNEFKNAPKEFDIERFILDNELNTVKVAIFNGPQIYFNTQEDTINQVNKLIVIIDEKLKDNYTKLLYIDLRYGDRVYYR